jgi:hypothetical protein
VAGAAGAVSAAWAKPITRRRARRFFIRVQGYNTVFFPKL